MTGFSRSGGEAQRRRDKNVYPPLEGGRGEESGTEAEKETENEEEKLYIPLWRGVGGGEWGTRIY